MLKSDLHDYCLGSSKLVHATGRGCASCGSYSRGGGPRDGNYKPEILAGSSASIWDAIGDLLKHMNSPY